MPAPRINPTWPISQTKGTPAMNTVFKIRRMHKRFYIAKGCKVFAIVVRSGKVWNIHYGSRSQGFNLKTPNVAKQTFNAVTDEIRQAIKVCSDYQLGIDNASA